MIENQDVAFLPRWHRRGDWKLGIWRKCQLRFFDRWFCVNADFLSRSSKWSLFVSAFPVLFLLDRLLTTLFPILFLLRLDEVGDFTFLQNSWQSIYNFKIIFVQNFSLTSVFVGILNSIQEYFWNLLIFIFMNCFFNTSYSANFMIVLVSIFLSISSFS